MSAKHRRSSKIIGAEVVSNESGKKNPVVFKLSKVTKTWPGDQPFNLVVPELTIRKGEKVALVGFSGCGKSTLLDLLAMVLRPDHVEEFSFGAPQGRQRLNVAAAWNRKDKKKLAEFRMRFIGYVLQTGGLLPFLSVFDNIGLSLRALGRPPQETVRKLADKLGIEGQLQKYPMQLSVGERQRAAIARAMAHEPAVVIADEPTAALDPINAKEVMNIFAQIAGEKNVTFIIATHEWKLVEEIGFRRITFDLDRDPADRTVRARVSG